MGELPQDLVGCSTAIPTALEEMMNSHNNIIQISNYCKTAFQQNGEATPELVTQTKQYANDALLNVAYHVHQLSVHLTNYLQVQAVELEKIDQKIRVCSDRFKAVHDQSGALAMRTMESVREYKRDIKLRKLLDSEMPANARGTGKYPRPPLNLSVLDSLQ